MSKLALLFLLLVSAASAVDFPAGKPVTLKVTFTGGTAPLKFAWTKDGQPLAATTDTYVIPVANANDAGTYSVVVSNSMGSTTAPGVVLALAASSTAPKITTQPLSQAIKEGEPVTLSSGASGTPAPAFQWFKNGVAIPGRTNSAMSIGAMTAGDVGTYTFRATNSGGIVTSNPAVLSLAVVVVAPAGAVITVIVGPGA